MRRAVTPSETPLFDPLKARGPRRGPDVGAADPQAQPAKPPAATSVSMLVARIKNALAESFPETVTVVGELSNCKLAASGHIYFRLKDAEAAIDAVMFRPQASRLKFRPEDGLEVVATARVEVYQPRGQLQLYVQRMVPKGAGALELAFRQLKEKLQREGLFDTARKQPIVRTPRAIGLITSPSGAAVRDIARTLRRRWPAAPVYLLPVLVQGEAAAGQIAQAVADLDAAAAALDVETLIVARGGGSLEDLWPFNEEIVARAIAAARTPVISGVGHETDVTIADLVADVRAATPTAAAELAVPDRRELAERLNELAEQVREASRDRIREAATALQAVQRSVVFRDPMWRLRAAAQHLDEWALRLPTALKDQLADARRGLDPLSHRLAALHPARVCERAGAHLDRFARRLAWALGGRVKRAGDRLGALAGRAQAGHPKHRLALAVQRLGGLQRRLDATSYPATLARGFSVTRAAGSIVRSARDIQPGDQLDTELSDGHVASTADGPARPRRKRQNRSEGPTLFQTPLDDA